VSQDVGNDILPTNSAIMEILHHCRLNSVEEVLTPRVRLGARHISFAGLLL